MWVVCDIECDSLTPSVIWCIVCKEIDTGKVHTFRDLRVFLDFSKKISGVIGHNIIGYDLPVLKKFIPQLHLTLEDCIDTLVVSRLLNFGIGKHSLEAWGERLGILKTEFHDFSKYSDEMLKYCIQDVEVTHKLYLKFQKYIESPQWAKALKLEHDTAIICNDLHDNGFVFNKPKAQELLNEVTILLSSIDEELQLSFPPKTKLIREINPKATKSGALSLTDFRFLKTEDSKHIDLSVYTLGAPFSRFEWVEFNPGSHKQVVERLNEIGWEPFEKTKAHADAEKDGLVTSDHRTYGWKLSEANLETIPPDAPESTQKLVQRFLLANRRSTLEQWLSLTSEAPIESESTSRIHGRFHHIGAWSHRMSHSDPNMANAPSVDSKYQGDELKAMARYWGHEMRALFTVPSDSLLVGVDAEGIQLRVLAHYMNDPVFTEALVNGSSKDGTDVHTLNANILGVERPRSKTFVYAWLLGASVSSGKIPHILGCSKRQAKDKVEEFLEAYPGLKKLRTHDIPRDASNGYFVGLDDRLVLCNSEHLMLAGYLQNGEALIMKHATQLWYDKLIRKEMHKLKFINYVHDEWETEVRGDMELAEYVGKVQADCIRQAGIDLGLRCPLAGNYKIGKTWYDVH